MIIRAFTEFLMRYVTYRNVIHAKIQNIYVYLDLL